MKKTLSVLAIAAMVMLTACTPQQSETPITDVLKSAKKGWVMTSVKSVPAYVLESGVALEELYADGDYEHNTGFFTAAEKDDAIIFGENGVQTIEPGTVLPSDGSAYQVATVATYTVNEATEELSFQMRGQWSPLFDRYCLIQEYQLFSPQFQLVECHYN